MSSAASTLLQMGWCVAGIYLSFGLWSLLQEKLTTRPYLVDGEPRKFHYHLVLNLVQMSTAALLSYLVMVAESSFNAKYREHQHHHHHHHPQPNQEVKKIDEKKKGSELAPAGEKIPAVKKGSNVMLVIATVGFSCAFASPFGYAALKYVSYPAVLTAKMCKMVPVILVGMVYHGTKYSIPKCLDCLCITIGVLAFSFLEDKGGKDSGRSSSLVGLLLVGINLTLDGYTNSTQDVIVKVHKWSGHKLMFGTNLSAALWTAAALLATHGGAYFFPEVVSSEMAGAMDFISRQPEAGWDLVMMGLLNGFGQFFVFRAMSVFGSLTVTAMTLVRKIGSVMLSIWFHNHSVSAGQGVALGLVVIGVIIDTVLNVREKQQQQHQHKQHLQQPTGEVMATPPSKLKEKTKTK